MANQLSFGNSNTSQNRFFWRNVYDITGTTTYNAYDVVSYLGSSYVALTTSLNVLPTIATAWAQMTASGSVTSVASRVGAVVLSSSDLTDKDAASGVAGLDVSGFLKAAEANVTLNAQTGITYTVVATDRGKLLTFNNASPVAVTVPQAIGSFASGFFVEIENIGVGVATLTPGGGSTIDGAASLTLGQFQSITLTSNGTNYVCMRSKPIILAADIPATINSVIINPSATGAGAALTVGGTSATTGGISVFVGASGAQNERLSVVPADGSSAAARVGTLSVRTAAAGFLAGAEVAKIDAAGAFTGRGGIVLQTASGTLPAQINNDTAGGVDISSNGLATLSLRNAGPVIINAPGMAVQFRGATSGTTNVQATAVAGATTLTLPAATDILVGKATTDTLSNKTLTGVTTGNNVSVLNAQGAVAAITGTGADAIVYTYTLPANTVDTTSKGIRVTVSTHHGTGTASPLCKINLNGVNVVSGNIGTVAGQTGFFQATIMRASATTAGSAGISTSTGALQPFGFGPGSLTGLAWGSNQALTFTFNVAATDQMDGFMFLVEQIQ